MANVAQDYYNWGTVPGIMGQMMPDSPNPADAANPYFNQMEQQLPGYFNPWIDAGKGALPQLQSQYGQLMNDPGGMFNKFGGSYQASPGFKFQVDQATNASNRAAAAGGMLGTPMQQQNIASTVNGLANQDYYNYMNHVMGMYGQGLTGEGNMANMGREASGSLGEDLAQAMMSQAGLAYAGQADQNQAQQGKQGQIWGAIGGLAGAL